MECDICGSKEGLVKVKNEDGDLISLCSACYETQYEGYEATDDSDLSDEDDWDEESDEDSLADDNEIDEDEPLEADNEEDK